MRPLYAKPFNFPMIIEMMLNEAMTTFKNIIMKQKLRKTGVVKVNNCSAIRLVLYYDKSLHN